MRQQAAKELMRQTQSTYNAIAQDFSRTRAFVYPALYTFKNYVKDGDRVLDIGCGNGRILRIFKGMKINYLGVDASPNLIIIARHNYPQYRFEMADAISLDIDEKDFDAVTMSAVLHHIPSKELRSKMVQRVHEILKPGGRLLMANWNLWQLGFWKYHFKYTWQRFSGKQDLDFGDFLKRWGNTENFRYFHALTLKELDNLARQHGFSRFKNFYTLRNGDRGNFLNSDNIFSIWQK